MDSKSIDTGALTEGIPVDRRRDASRSKSSGPALVPGASVVAGRFKIVRGLGKGGMGAVYKARDRTLKKQVALKFRLVRQEETEQEAARNRQLFLDEASRAQEITHPHVCRIFDVHEAGGYEVISMEFIDGEDLAALLHRIDRVTPSRAVKLGLEICDGLAAIHEQGLFHQDLKPHNIMIDREGRAKISDLGLAGSRFQGGTPQYTAPEQWALRRVSVQSDLYALGLVLYEMLTGRRAFEHSCLQDPPPPPPRTLVPEIDSEVEQIVLHCLHRHPQERPRSAMEVAKALASAMPRALGHSGTSANRQRKWNRLSFWIFGAGLLAAIASLMPLPPPSELITPGGVGQALTSSEVISSSSTKKYLYWKKTGTRLVFVPGGEYKLGADELGEDTGTHTVHLSPYWIAEVPVTNASYEAFLDANPGVMKPRTWKDVAFNHPSQPQVGVTWEESRTYCRWAGLELTSEAQWEAAARGAGDQERYPYPWGAEEANLSRAHFGWRPLEAGEGSDPGQPAFVGSFPNGAGPFGTFDQAGNVWEWCIDAWSPEAYENRNGTRDPVQEAQASVDRVVRGGSWLSPAKHLHVAYRAKQWGGRQSEEVGFRCALLAN